MGSLLVIVLVELEVNGSKNDLNWVGSIRSEAHSFSCLDFSPIIWLAENVGDSARGTQKELLKRGLIAVVSGDPGICWCSVSELCGVISGVIHREGEVFSLNSLSQRQCAC